MATEKLKKSQLIWSQIEKKTKQKKESAEIVVASCWTTGDLTENGWETLRFSAPAPDLMLGFLITVSYIIMVQLRNCPCYLKELKYQINRQIRASFSLSLSVMLKWSSSALGL